MNDGEEGFLIDFHCNRDFEEKSFNGIWKLNNTQNVWKM